MGMKGSGVTTQIDMLSKKFKINKVNLYEKYIETLNSEKNKRKRARMLARGFRPLPEVEEGEDPPLDDEIEQDPEDFDIAAHERDVLHMVLEADKAIAFDGNWRLPEEPQV